MNSKSNLNDHYKTYIKDKTTVLNVNCGLFFLNEVIEL